MVGEQFSPFGNLVEHLLDLPLFHALLAKLLLSLGARDFLFAEQVQHTFDAEQLRLLAIVNGYIFEIGVLAR